MTGLGFHVEWEAAPSVRSPVLAATWARLEIRVEGAPVTRFWSKATNGVREGVYGSVFPLARWVVAHWWHLLEEEIRSPDVIRGACLAGTPARAWLTRHNLVLARDGMAYPDLAIYREDDRVGLRWVADPDSVTTPGRFLGDGAARLGRDEVEAGLATLVTTVLERTEGLAAEEVVELRADWDAIVSASQDERRLCARLAALGADPYAADPDADVEALLAGELALPEPALHDVLAVAAASGLAGDLQLAQRLIAQLPAITTGPGAAVDSAPYDPRPYRAGYRRAAAIRQQLGLDPVEPVTDLAAITERLAGPVTEQWIEAGRWPAIEAAVGRNGVCALAASSRPPRAQRFLQARALHHWQFVTQGASAVRLLTRGSDWQQSASRAFAAELLAPAAALAARLGGDSGWDRQEQLAEELQVSTQVIAHQLENHGLS